MANQTTPAIQVKDSNVGIGIASPAQKLHIGGIARVSDGIIVDSGSVLQLDHNYAVHGYLQYSSSAFGTETQFGMYGYYGINLYTRQGSGLVVRGDSNNVGIGTTSPSAKLHVAGNIKVGGTATYNSINIYNNAAAGGGGVVAYQNDAAVAFFGTAGWYTGTTDTGAVIGTDSNSRPIRFYTSSERMRITGDGNVGIGTTSPAALLDVNGTFNSSGVVSGAGLRSNNIGGATTSGTGWFKIAKVDSRGGGVIKLSFTGGSYGPVTYVIKYHKDWASTTTLKLEKYGASSFITDVRFIQDDSDSKYYIEFLTASDSLSFQVYHDWTLGYNASTTMYTGTLSAGAASGTTTSSLPFITYGTSTHYQHVSSALGVGTSDPLRNLHVGGTFAVNAGTGQYYGVNITGGEGTNPTVLIGDWHNASANLTWDSTNRLLRIDSQYSTSGAPIVFSGNDAAIEYARFTATGNLGIGTSSPSAKLRVEKSEAGSNWLTSFHNTATNGHNMYFGYGNAAGTRYGLYIEGGPGNTNLDFAVANKFYVLGNGNVGIGTDNPSARLHIENNAVSEPLALFKTSSGDASIRIEGAGGESYLEIANTATSGSTTNSWGIGMNDNTNLSFGWGANSTLNKTDALVIKTDGNVGIGTTSPAEKLHIDGGNIKINNSNAGTTPGLYISNASQTGNQTQLYSDITGTPRSILRSTERALWIQANSSAGGGASNDLRLFTNGNLGLTVDYLGNVGIGTTSPVSRLQVAGRIAGGELGNPNITRNGLTLYLDFNDKACHSGGSEAPIDLSPSNYTIGITGGANFEYKDGIGVYYFDDSSDHIDVTNFYRGDTGVTYEAWVYANALSSWDTIFDSGTERPLLGFFNGALRAYPAGENFFTATTGRWYHIAFAFASDSDLDVYVNGYRVSDGYDWSNGGTYTSRSGTFNLWIGGDNSTETFNGYIAIARTYNRQLQPQELLQNYNAEVSRFATVTPALGINQLYDKVGIGTTNPKLGLHVEDGKGLLVGHSGASGSMYVSPSDENTINGSYGIASDSADIWLNYKGYQDGWSYFRDTRIGNGKGSAILMVDGSEGHVGIGTTAPITKLHINTSSNALPASAALMSASAFAISGADGNMDLFSTDDNSTVSNNIGFGRYHISTGALIHKFGITSWANTGSQGSNSGSRIAFNYGTSANVWDNTELMAITSGGNVGIGTTSPTTHSGGNALVVAGKSGIGNGRAIIELHEVGGSSGKAVFQQVATTTYIGNLGGNGALSLLTGGSGTNASESMYISSGGNVGIGTTSPEGKLDVVGSTINGTQQSDWSNDGISYNSYGDLTISKRHGATKNSTWGFTGPLIDLRSSNTGNEWSVAQIMGTVDSFGGNNHQGGLMFLTSAGGTTDPTGRRTAGAAPQVRMAIGPTGQVYMQGNVGIGTTSPSKKLHVYESGAADAEILVTSTYADGYDAQITLQNTHTGGRTYEILSTNNSRGTIGGGKFVINDRTANDSAARLVINSSGNVAIGSNDASYKLDVSGGIRATEYFISSANSTVGGISNRDWVFLGPQGDAASNAAGAIIGDINGAKYGIYGGSYDLTFSKHRSDTDTFHPALTILGSTATDSSPNVYITNSLGINITSPSERLHVAGNIKASSSGTYARLNLSSLNNDYYLQVEDSTFDGIGFYKYSPATAGWQMVINTDGNVGIGTTSPAYRLDVSGGAIAIRGNAPGNSLRFDDTTATSRNAMYVDTSNYLNVGNANYTGLKLYHSTTTGPSPTGFGGQDVQQAIGTVDNGVVLAAPDAWLQVRVGTTDYVIPMYTTG